MSQLSLHPDDLPPAQITSQDLLLFRQFEDSISRCFYENCDGVTQALLLSCEWSIRMRGDVPVLTIVCPDQASNWRVLNNLVKVAAYLTILSKQAKIRICPPAGLGIPFEMRVDEGSIYRDMP